jgi:hypothetical protein
VFSVGPYQLPLEICKFDWVVIFRIAPMVDSVGRQMPEISENGRGSNCSPCS